MDVIHQKQRAKELRTSQLGGERRYADAKNQLFYGGVQINTGEVVSSLFAHFKLKRTKNRARRAEESSFCHHLRRDFSKIGARGFGDQN